MSFLYRECSPESERKLKEHLRECSQCAAQMKAWRVSMAELDTWKVPAGRAKAQRAVPMLKWATAAAAVLLLGFLVGRQTSSSASEMAALKASVSQLKELMQSQSAATFSNSVAASTTAASNESLRLLANYSQALEEQRANDQQTVNLALRAFGGRLNRMSDDLEAMAVSTETGFQETHDNITRVATLSLATRD